MKYPVVCGAIREKYGTQTAFAEAMNMHYSTLSKKLRGSSDWTRQEIARACQLLGISVSAFF